MCRACFQVQVGSQTVSGVADVVETDAAKTSLSLQLVRERQRRLAAENQLKLVQVSEWAGLNICFDMYHECVCKQV